MVKLYDNSDARRDAVIDPGWDPLTRPAPARENAVACHPLPQGVEGQAVTLPSANSHQPSAFCLLPLSAFRSSAFCLLLSAFCLSPARAQVETVQGPPTTHYVWSSEGRFEGHLAVHYSPEGAFSPDGSLLAVSSDEKIVLVKVGEGDIQKVLKIHLPDMADLNIQSANFLTMNQLFLLGTGVISAKGKGGGRPTPLLAFQWDTIEDRFSGKLEALGGKGGFGPILYMPRLQCMVLYKASNFDMWEPRSGRGGRLTVPDLTQTPNVVAFSPDGHWVLLAQIATSSSPDPTVVEAKEHRFVDSLRGHQGTVLGISFSADSSKVVTACEDGKLRIFSAPDWKLLKTLTGHNGPVHWAEFSPDGKWLVSAGEDRTARVWSVEDGTLQQTLEESKEPLLTVSFSPNGETFAASAANEVLLWKRAPSAQ